MPYYRVYTVGDDGRFVSGVNIECADDQAAIESAKQFVDGLDVELWEGGRKIVRLESPKKSHRLP